MIFISAPCGDKPVNVFTGKNSTEEMPEVQPRTIKSGLVIIAVILALSFLSQSCRLHPVCAVYASSEKTELHQENI